MQIWAMMNQSHLIPFFFKLILKSPGDRTPDINCTVECVSQDILFTTWSKNCAEETFFRGMRLYSLVGLRKVIGILYKFANHVSYNDVCEVEIAYTEVAQ